ncbi:MAG TPA: PIN domain-containing protein [Candidatus Acidoferrum sp.]|nr:PIN domain-containing protein [Candidatus Acidoferrum sp.]
MDRVFLDANVLFSAAYRSDAGLSQLWKLKQVMLCSSRYAVEEARANLADEDQRIRLNHLSSSLALFEAGEKALPRVLLPEKDRPILLAAFAARATHLLTGDVKHFGPYFGTKIMGIAIMLPGAYLHA